MKITPLSNTLLFCNICIESKMTKQLYQDSKLYFTTIEFWLHANVGRGGDIYAIFQGFCYFIFFVYKATGYV